jgi:predicted DNA binding CopG/RHH family protein
VLAAVLIEPVEQGATEGGVVYQRYIKGVGDI